MTTHRIPFDLAIPGSGVCLVLCSLDPLRSTNKCSRCKSGGAQEETFTGGDLADRFRWTVAVTDLLALTSIFAEWHQLHTDRLLWIQAIRDHFDNVPLFVSNCKQLQLALDAALVTEGYSARNLSKQPPVHATRTDPEDPLSSLQQVSKGLTMLQPIYFF